MDQDELKNHVETLATHPRVPYTHEHTAARAYIRQELSAYGYRVSETNSSDGPANVFAEWGPRNGQVFVVGAHYDTVLGSPGADDNASGVAALLAIANELMNRGQRPRKRLQLVAYDGEELGLLGSAAHCKALHKEGCNVAGMFSLEMLGYVADEQKQVPGVSTGRTKGDFLAVVSNLASVSLLNAFENLDVERITIERGSPAMQLAKLSDHGSFWSSGWPALLITDTAFLRNPHYHQPTDIPATLNYDFLLKSAEVVVSALSELIFD